MNYIATMRFYRSNGGLDGWTETVTCRMSTPGTWEEVQIWFSTCRINWPDTNGWKILNQEVKDA